MYDEEKIAKIKTWLGTGSINIFGRPFSGKDFQGQRLALLLGGNLVGGGDILRRSTTAEHINEYMRNGKLIPSEDYANIVFPYLDQPKLSGTPLILSSVGRWHGEEDGVIRSLDKSSHTLKAVIYLNISNIESHERWLAREINNDRSDRHDDTETILNIRFAEFAEKTEPVIDFYRKKGLLIEVDGKGARDEITKNIIEALYSRSVN